MSTGMAEPHPNYNSQKGALGSHLLRQGIVIIALLSTLAINYLSTALPINGMTPGEISDRFPVRFTPAGYVFAIWSIIYLGLMAYAVYQALPSQRLNPRLVAIAWPFVLSCLANSLWIFAWHYGYFPLSLLFMLVLLGALITIYLRLVPAFRSAPAIERWSTHIPFRIYLGWITVATIANTTIVLYDQGWRGAPFSEPLWAAILLGIATVIGLFFALRLRDAAYTLVLVWAFVGIYVKQNDAALVAYTAAGLALVLALAAIYAIVQHAVSSE
jgi:benzodiazapine receptor